MLKSIKHYFGTNEALIDNAAAKEKYLSLFITAFLGMLVALLPGMIQNHGVFIYYGDFNTQQQMFYHHMHDMVRSGNFGWDWGTDLGTGVVGTWSFYLLGSPFFWLTVPFPSSWTVYLIPWLLCLKVGFAAICAYAYLRRFVSNKDAAFIGAMLYAFSGFQTYNVFFNHFHDVTAFFPLMLLTLEMLVNDNKKGVFALSVALLACISYFFFVGEVVFIIIYFILRCFDPDFRKNLSLVRLFYLAGEAIVGFAIAMIFILPSVMQTTGNYRVVKKFIGLDFVLYVDKARVARIFQAFFTLSDMPARINIFDVTSAKWASLAGYLPLFSMSGVIAYYIVKKQSGKRDWLCWALIVFTVMACVPFLNSAFVLFNSSYYARWYYMPILLFCLMTAIVLDKDPSLLKKGFPITAIAGVGFLCVGSLPKYIKGKYTFFHLAVYPELYHIQIAVTLTMIVLLAVLVYILLNSRIRDKINWTRIALLVTVVSCVICNSSEVYYGVKQSAKQKEFYLKAGLHGKKNLNLDRLASKSTNNKDRKHFYRIDVAETKDGSNADNFNMYWDLSSMRCFHSTVTPSILDFYRGIGQTRDVASRMGVELYPLRSLFSVQYYFVKSTGNNKPQTVKGLEGFRYIDTQNHCHIYENKNFLPMGFAFDCYTTDDIVKKADKNDKPHILLKALVLDKEQIEHYKDIITKYDFKKTDCTYDVFKKNCDDRRAESCYSFEHNSYGFTGRIKLDKSKLVFFSVPYEKGWSAKVNGQPVKVEKVDYGFMAVAVPAGDNEIVFKYHAYGQTAGIIFTIIGILLLVGYMIYFRFFAKKQPVPVQDNEAQNIAADVIEQPPVSDTDSLPET